MTTNKRILDYDLQLVRLFADLIPTTEYENREVAEGTYDYIFCHREGIQDNYEHIKSFTHSTTKIVVDLTTESGNLQPFLDYFYELTNTEPYQFYLILDTDITSYLNKVKVNYKVLHSFEIVYYAFLNEKSDNIIMSDVSAFKNGFVSLNNSVRPQRIALLLEFLKRNIPLDNCSFLFTTAGPLGSVFTPEIYRQSVQTFNDNNEITADDVKLLMGIKLPKLLDHDVNTPTYIHNNINYLYEPILNFVTENVTGIDKEDISRYGLLTYTEKCIKPFVAGQIPLMLSLVGTQDVLRGLGFDLFDDLIDTSYEKEPIAFKRLSMMVDELERLLKMDLVEYKKNNIHRFEHNVNNLHRLKKSGFEMVKSFLYDEIYK